MSSDISLTARNLGKRYNLFRNPASRLAQQFLPIVPQHEHWALRGLNLEARRGDCVGIVGRNGSGKSTLLAMLAGILEPTEGSIEMHGRIAALLELGAGFHPDFTGRDNVFLAASIYGLTEADIRHRLPSIEEFAGIGEFIDRPVREYSSGMYARLAFAVAAHVDAEILIVDEILGVGDVRFQQRCARFISEFRNRGIVLLVSHSELPILSLCNRAVWLGGGQAQRTGSPRDVVLAYRTASARDAGTDVAGFFSGGRLLDGLVNSAAETEDEDRLDFYALPLVQSGGRIRSCELSLGGRPLRSAKGGEDVVLRIACEVPPTAKRAAIGFALRDRIGQVILGADSSEFEGGAVTQSGAFEAEFAFRLPYFPSGGYTIDALLIDLGGPRPVRLDHRDEAVVFQVLSRHISPGSLANVAMRRTEFLVDGKSQPT